MSQGTDPLDLEREELRHNVEHLARLTSHDPSPAGASFNVDAMLLDFHERLTEEDLASRTAQPTVTPLSTASTTTRRRWLMLAAACLLIAVAVAGSLILTQPKAEASSPPQLDFQVDINHIDRDHSGSSATAKLRELSKLALQQPATLPRGTTQRIESYIWALDSVTDQHGTRNIAIVPTLRDLHLFADGAFEATETNGPPITARGRIPKSSGSPGGQSAPTTDIGQPGSLNPAGARDLSTNPDELRRQLIEQAGPIGPDNPATAAILQQVRTLNDTYVIDNELDAALWEVLADQTDLHDGGVIEDRQGNQVQAILYLEPTGAITALLIDTRSGALAGYEQIVPNEDETTKAAEPMVVQYLTSYITHTWTSDSEPRPTLEPNPASSSEN